jgi:pimeloyl-ACP methyl ester carboxylesterase
LVDLSGRGEQEPPIERSHPIRLTLVTVLLALVAAGCSVSGSDAPASSESSEATQAATTEETESDFAGLVDIGGVRKMYLECRGTGSPTVVLVSGFRGSHDDWTNVLGSDGNSKPSRSAVFPEVSKFTRVCAYDRPGTTTFDGKLTPSTPVPQPTTAQDGAADLHALLRAAKQPGPYVLVAHSWGGLIGRLYGSTYPDEVSGLVLVDPGSEFLQDTLTPAQWAKFVRGAKQPGKPKDLEAANYRPTVRELRAAPPVRGIPAVVLTSDKCFEFVPGAGGAAATCEAWGAAQDRLATLLNARHITDTNSSHFIAGEQPQLVTDAVRQVVDAVRDGAETVGVVEGPE